MLITLVYRIKSVQFKNYHLKILPIQNILPEVAVTQRLLYGGAYSYQARFVCFFHK